MLPVTSGVNTADGKTLSIITEHGDPIPPDCHFVSTDKIQFDKCCQKAFLSSPGVGRDTSVLVMVTATGCWTLNICPGPGDSGSIKPFVTV